MSFFSPVTARFRAATKWLVILLASVTAILVGIACIAVAVMVYQGKRSAAGNPQYVALGSSFAAGLGLGPRAPGSPVACMRTLNGYPQQLARMLNLAIVDKTCSGATTDHILHGGQFFQPPQLDGLGRKTELVTITTGGNDVRYIVDMSLLASHNSRTFLSWALKLFYKSPLRPENRNFEQLRLDLVAMLENIHRRSPVARVILVSYPTILPPTGTCQKIGVNTEEAATMRQVASRLTEVTRAAAQQGHAIFIDMNEIGSGHDACSREPWVNGYNDAEGAQFHPTLLGARFTARAIASELAAGQHLRDP